MGNKWTEYRKRWARKHPEKEREYAKRYRHKHAKQLREAQRAYRKQRPDLHRKWARENYRKHALKEMLKKYGLTPEQWLAMYDGQYGRCAICSTKPRNGKYSRSLAVDHCHTSKNVRALLCYSCNNKIKAFEDPTWYRKALDYLKLHGTFGRRSNQDPRVYDPVPRARDRR